MMQRMPRRQFKAMLRAVTPPVVMPMGATEQEMRNLASNMRREGYRNLIIHHGRPEAASMEDRIERAEAERRDAQDIARQHMKQIEDLSAQIERLTDAAAASKSAQIAAESQLADREIELSRETRWRQNAEQNLREMNEEISGIAADRDAAIKTAQTEMDRANEAEAKYGVANAAWREICRILDCTPDQSVTLTVMSLVESKAEADQHLVDARAEIERLKFELAARTDAGVQVTGFVATTLPVMDDTVQAPTVEPLRAPPTPVNPLMLPLEPLAIVDDRTDVEAAADGDLAARAQAENTKAFLAGRDISGEPPEIMTGLSRLAKLYGAEAERKRDLDLMNPDEIAQALNARAGMQDRLTARDITRILLELQRHRKAGAA